tara:strand:- start:803 stop:1081 length:279 start_codon:yes stop_codon:yes gene_type:complete
MSKKAHPKGSGYESLEKENERLREENATLITKIRELEFVVQKYRSKDFVRKCHGCQKELAALKSKPRIEEGVPPSPGKRRRRKKTRRRRGRR